MEQMPYQRFARVYDLFMADTPYGSWACYIKSAWARHGVNPGLVLDLGCGTGSLSALLREMGCDMIGVDASEEMLSEAYGKTEGILLLKQDMRELDLYGTVASIVCFCDSLNYLTDDGDLLKVFKLCHNYLDPGGLFVFDVNTYKKYNEVLANNDFCGVEDEACYLWENSFDPETRLNEYRITFFEKASKGLYERFEENHIQRAYLDEEILSALKESGFELLETADGETMNEATELSDRKIYATRCLKG